MSEEALDTKLLKFYRKIVSKRAELAEQGEHLPGLAFSKSCEIYTGEDAKSINYLEYKIVNDAFGTYYGKEPRPSESSADLRKEVHEIRERVLAEELYDKLKQSEEDGINLKNIAGIVSHPVLDAAFDFLEGGYKTREEFVEGFDPRMHLQQPRLSHYIQALSFIEVVAQNPEAVEKLDENSVYAPNRLFKKPAEIKESWSKEVERGIAEILPDLFSEKLREIIPKIEEYIVDPMNEEPGLEMKVGKYSIPPYLNIRFDYREKDPEQVEQELDELFGTPEVKQELYETLASCLKIIGVECHKSGYDVKKLRQVSEFGCTKTEFERAIFTLRNYATNQLFGSWLNNPGEYIAETPLSRSTGVEIRENTEDDLTLQLTKESGKPTMTLTEQSRFMGTRMYLPFCAHLLNRFYQAAMEIEEQEMVQNVNN